MSTTPLSARQSLLHEIDAALGRGATGQDLVDLIIRSGWQPRPLPDPDTEYIEGLLGDGRRVPIEIRRSTLSRVG